MRLTRIYQACALSSGEVIPLSAQAQQHLIQVLRLTVGDAVIIFNGEGGEYMGELVAVNKKTYGVAIQQFVERDVESPLKIHLAQSISRPDRMDLTLQKAVELGVYEITPLVSERCQGGLTPDRLQKRWQHWQGIIISATEQCGRTQLPCLHPPQTLTSWLPNTTQAALKLVLHHRTQHTLKSLTIPAKITLLVGPEGGLSLAEINLAESHNFQALCLGPRVLRTETAALAALAILQAQWGDLT